jgi:hypothetical protein
MHINFVTRVKLVWEWALIACHSCLQNPGFTARLVITLWLSFNLHTCDSQLLTSGLLNLLMRRICATGVIP